MEKLKGGPEKADSYYQGNTVKKSIQRKYLHLMQMVCFFFAYMSQIINIITIWVKTNVIFNTEQFFDIDGTSNENNGCPFDCNSKIAAHIHSANRI